MPKRSAGLLLHRRRADGQLEVLLLHFGGPMWANRDAGAWTVPKGEYDESEDPAGAARREFAEETGAEVPPGSWVDLGEIRQSASKTTRLWALAGDFDVEGLSSNTFEMTWPPNSGRTASFPEVDRAEWMTLGDARERMVKGLRPFLDRLTEKVGA